MTTIPLPPPTEPFVDLKTGQITTPWYQFLTTAGGISDTTGTGSTVVLQTNPTITAPNISQVVFPATQDPSSDPNTLDDYEEGTWTPAFSAAGATFSHNNQDGIYTKIGNLVRLGIRISLNTSGNTLAGATLTLTGFPFTISDLPTNPARQPIWWFESTSTLVSVFIIPLTGGTTAQFRHLTAAATSFTTTNDNVLLHATNGSLLIGNMQYGA